MKKIKIIAGFTLAALAFLLFCILDFQSWEKLDIDKILNTSAASVIFDKEGNEIGAVGKSQNALFIDKDRIPEYVKNAFVACEDQRFYSHSGIDIKRILASLVNNIKAGAYLEGGSTITQQLVKLTHLTQEKKISRKANEAWLALKLERKLDKNEILAAYLNTVYFGAGAYGIENACRIYFGKSGSEISLSEAAALAGIIKAPSAYSPNVNPEKTLERRNYVLSRMYEDGYISYDEMEKAKKENIRIIGQSGPDEYGWYRDFVLKEAGELLSLSSDQVLSGGFRIYTSLDTQRQKRIENIFENENWFPQDAQSGEKAQSAFVALDTQTGGILCMVGGREYEVKRGFNRACDAKRQPGSALKPLSVYAAAIDGLGMLPSSVADDTKRVFDGGYAPKNAGGSYNGLVTLREALSRSLNVASVSLIEFTGIERTRSYIKRFGLPLDSADNGLALALGSMTNGVTPMELASGYAALSNGGSLVKPHAIEKIIDRSGRTVYAFTPLNKRAVKRESAYMITSMLETAAKTGSARALSIVPCSIAAKTGTVSVDDSRNRDAWTLAYTTDISACIWMGFDQTKEDMYLKASESGSFAAKLMAEFMKEENGRKFEMPSTLVEVPIDKTALQNQKRIWLAPENAPALLTEKEIFVKGKEPSVLSPAFQTPNKPAKPDIYESGDEIILRFTIQSDIYEYLLFEEIDGNKKLIASESGTNGEIKEIRIKRDTSDAVYTLAVRNKLMQESGITLVSAESESVLVEGKMNITDIFENLMTKFE